MGLCSRAGGTHSSNSAKAKPWGAAEKQHGVMAQALGFGSSPDDQRTPGGDLQHSTLRGNRIFGLIHLHELEPPDGIEPVVSRRLCKREKGPQEG